MYNFQEEDADKQLMHTLKNEFSYIPNSSDQYVLFESYIQYVYAQVNYEEESKLEMLNNACITIACNELYAQLNLLHKPESPNSILGLLLDTGLVLLENSTPHFRERTYAYFFISKLISSWEEARILEFLSEKFFKPSAVYLRIFLRSYAYVDDAFQPILESLLRTNLFNQCRPVNAFLQITSASQLTEEMVCGQNREFGGEFLASFMGERDLNNLRRVLCSAFRLVNQFQFGKADEEHIATLGSLFVHYLHQLQLHNQLSREDIQGVLQTLTDPTYRINFTEVEQVLGNEEATFNFLKDKCNEIQFVLLVQYIKYFHSHVNVDVQEMNNNRFTDITGLNVRLPQPVEHIMNTYPLETLSLQAVCFERVGTTVALGTMTLTDEMMYVFNYFLRAEGGWGEVYRKKTLRNFIIPFIHMKMENYPCYVNQQMLLELLLLFSRSSFERQVESHALNNTIRFVEHMVELDINNLKYFVQFLSYLRQHYFCLVTTTKNLSLINERFDFIYEITMYRNIISNIFQEHSADTIAEMPTVTLAAICTELLQANQRI